MRRTTSRFTLIELIAVLAVILLISGLIIPAISRKPSNLILRKTADEISGLMSSARSQAMLQGCRIYVRLNEKTISIDANRQTQEEAEAKKLSSLVLDEEISVEIADASKDKGYLYVFFPDGTAHGPDIRLKLKNSSLDIYVSPISGMSFIKDQDNDKS